MSISQNKGFSIEEYTNGLQKRDRLMLSKCITLIESSLEADREIAESLIEQALPLSVNSQRLAVSGPPGIGKSTFIEALGLTAIKNGHKVAVLAIDPSSEISGGSILGDKTRMQELAANKDAFIRPTAGRGHVGGAAVSTRESIILCEAAGYDTIIIETIGVGQSEYVAKNFTDLFLLLTMTNTGDELQGIKKGIMEIADMIIINKSDRDPEGTTELKNELESLLRGNKNAPIVETCSAIQKSGIDAIWNRVTQSITQLKKEGLFEKTREVQNKTWFTETLKNRLLDVFFHDKEVESAIKSVQESIHKENFTPYNSVKDIIGKWRNIF